ncbi:MAG: DUF2971 domain-containing protein [Chitinophagales bacterium]|nr:DUF2971 domain-containing protein [Chitinophagales bacterium]
MPQYHHEKFIPIDSNLTVWRYINLKKFKSLLKEKSFFFCRADKFADPFEGSIPKKEAEHRLEEAKRNASHPTTFELEKRAQLSIEPIKILHRNIKRSFIINCWHINMNESDAMWKLYLKTNKGVAIQSTTNRLSKVINNATEEIIISKVRYLNYDTDIWFDPVEYPHKNYNLFTPLIHKRKEFQHETELRLLHRIEEAIDEDTYWDKQPNLIGKSIKLDISQLIEKIYLPPTADSSFENHLKGIISKYGYNFELCRSKLSFEPTY